MLDYVNSPASEAAQRQPQLTTSWVQRFGLPLYATSVGDNDWDFAVPVLRSGGVDPAQAKLIGADGNRSAYDRIRKGDQYQVVTVSEPIELQAWQAVDELNRAFHNEPPSGFVQPPFLVTKENIHSEGGDKNTFIPEQQLQAALSRNLGRQIALGQSPAGWSPPGRIADCRRLAEDRWLGMIGHGTCRTTPSRRPDRPAPRHDRARQALHRDASPSITSTSISIAARFTRCSARTAPASRP